MRGQNKLKKPVIRPDQKYNSVKVAKFINYVMRDGKKSLATAVVYRAFSMIEGRVKKNPLEIFEAAIKNVEPMVEVRSRRVGGATYQVPMEVRPERRLALATRWIIESARSKHGQPMAEFLAQEIVDASNKTGAALTLRERMHKIAEANRAFAHFARY